MKYSDFNPFYERAIELYRGGFVEKILISIFIGGTVLGIQYWGIDNYIFNNKNNGWILSIIITVAMLCLFYATHTFRMLLPKLGSRLNQGEQNTFIYSISSHLSNKEFLTGGIIFGSLNGMMGHLFGLPVIYDSIGNKVIILGSYFITGFICGMAVIGIVGVTKCITTLSNNSESIFDYTSQDNCGGTQFIGWALLIFSAVTLVVGVLITVYISMFDWSFKSKLYVKILYITWILFPYIASIFVLLVPAISINKALTKYKLEKDKKLSNSIQKIFEELEGVEITQERKSELYMDYKFQTNMRKELHKMRTWPFNVGTNSTYFISIALSVVPTFKSVIKFFPSLA